MKIIKVENNDFDTAIGELIECRRTGEFAVLEVAGTVMNTTDDIPGDFDKMSRDDLDKLLIKVGSIRQLKMEAAKHGVYSDNLEELSIATTGHSHEQEDGSHLGL